jgi:hypothetical protein
MVPFSATLSAAHSLRRFIDSLVQLPPDVWHSWARQLAARVADHEDIPIRVPFFREVVPWASVVPDLDGLPREDSILLQ